ncbi:MAG: replication initiator protein A, partial [Candidatus Paceibacterota bacterium]
MNLAEFPLTMLSNRVDPKIKTLEFKDTIKNKDGREINREWVITGTDKFGLPTASDDEVLLGLLKLSLEDEFKNKKITFTRYELLKILRWPTEGNIISRLQKALDRLSGVRIKATNAFYDNDAKAHSTKNFGIIDAYEINDGRENRTKPSFFIWSDEIFQSFKSGFIKKLDLNFYLDLNSSISKRLYRFLDKNFWYRSKLKINLFVLCHEKIGISRNFKYASSLKQQLEPAIEELLKVNFISSVEYIGRGAKTEIVLSGVSLLPRSQQQPNSPEVPQMTGTPRPTIRPKSNLDLDLSLTARVRKYL